MLESQTSLRRRSFAANGSGRMAADQSPERAAGAAPAATAETSGKTDLASSMEWGLPMIWLSGSFIAYVVLQVLARKLTIHDTAAREQLLMEVPAGYYHQSVSAFFVAMALNLTSYIYEYSADKRQLALLLALVNGLSWNCKRQLLAGLSVVIIDKQGLIFQPTRMVQWLCTLPTLVFIVGRMAAAPPIMMMVAIGAEAAMVIFLMLASIAPDIFIYVLAIAAHGISIYTMYDMMGAVIKRLGDPTSQSGLYAAIIVCFTAWSGLPVAAMVSMLAPSIAPLLEIVTISCEFTAKFVFCTCIMFNAFETQTFETQDETAAEPRTQRSGSKLDSTRVKELQKRVDSLEESMSKRNKWMKIVGSELKTPLNATILLAQALARGSGGKLTERGEGWVSTINESSTHLLGVVNDILLVGAMGDGALTFNQEIVHVDELVNKVLKALGPLMPRGVVIEKAFAANLPPIIGDQSRLQQVISNLVDNSLKYTEKGRIQVRVRHDSSASNVIIKVADTGCGIPANEIAHIWESGEQATSGMGLSFVKLVVDAHHGAIDVKSIEGKGTTVICKLPVLQRNTRKSLEVVFRSAYSKAGHSQENLAHKQQHVDIMEDRMSVLSSRRSSMESNSCRRSMDSRRLSGTGFVTTLCVEDEDIRTSWPSGRRGLQLHLSSDHHATMEDLNLFSAHRLGQ